MFKRNVYAQDESVIICRDKKRLHFKAETYTRSVRCIFVDFQFLQRSHMIEYFVGAPFSLNCPCLITWYFCFGVTIS